MIRDPLSGVGRHVEHERNRTAQLTRIFLQILDKTIPAYASEQAAEPLTGDLPSARITATRR